MATIINCSLCLFFRFLWWGVIGIVFVPILTIKTRKQKCRYELNVGHFDIVLSKYALILTIRLHFLEHRTFVWHHCTLDQMGNLMGACQRRLSKRRIFGNQLGVGILDVRQLVPFHRLIWCCWLDNGIHLRLCLILQQVLKINIHLAVSSTNSIKQIERTFWSFASFTVGCIGPDTGARVFIEM